MPAFRRAIARAASCGAVLLATAALAAAQVADRLEGRSVADALRLLQSRGLRIVFSSATVPPDLRVAREPRATSPRERLAELLAPHGLAAEDGPGGTIRIVRAKAAPPDSRPGRIDGRVVDAGSAAPVGGVVVRVDDGPDARSDASGMFGLPGVGPGRRVIHVAAPGYVAATHAIEIPPAGVVHLIVSLSRAEVHREFVSVRRRWPSRAERGVASEVRLDREELDRVTSASAGDPVHAVHALPLVAAVDDFRSEFTVRGSALRHVGIAIDGVPARWLRHTTYGRGATGSLSMLPSSAVARASLSAGAYPRRQGDSLGPQLDLSLREGSRDAFRVHGVAGGTSATLLGEGPLGSSRSGSWLAAVRRSYLEWPVGRAAASRTPFGFSDALAKVVYDVRSGQQVGLTMLAGSSLVDGEDVVTPDGRGNGRNRALMANLSWRSTLSSGFEIRQQAFVVRQRFRNERASGARDDGANEEIAYRAAMLREAGRAMFEAGAEIGRSAIEETSPEAEAAPLTAASWWRSGYAHLSWAAAPALTISPGVRVTTSPDLPGPAVSQWLLAEWMFAPGWAVTASGGVAAQRPDVRHLLGGRAAPLAPERARYLDVAIERQLTAAVRWQATVFDRRERDVLREPEPHVRLVEGRLVLPAADTYSRLSGRSRGVELLLERRGDGVLSGWIAYSYGRTRHEDATGGEIFWSDFDQRHSLSVVGSVRLPADVRATGTFRGGSGFPIAGYLARRDGVLVAAAERNGARLPAYARLDVRAERTFSAFGRRMTVVAELLNVSNRTNVGLAAGAMDPATGVARGFTDRLLPRRVSAGVVVDF